MAQEELSGHIQDSIAFLCITSTDFLKIIRGHLRADLLPSETVYWVLKACYRYYDTTRTAPGDHICDAIQDVIKGLSESKRTVVFHYIDRISQMRAPNHHYVVRKLSDFIRQREFETAAVEFVKLVEKEKFHDAQTLMFGALRAGVESENIGCDYFTDLSSMAKEEQEVLMTMGLKEFDRVRKFHRQELLCLLGGYKGKKSWGGTHIGHLGLLRGLNVLHVTHENSQELTEERYDRMSGSLTPWSYRNQRKVEVTYLASRDTGMIRTREMKADCVSNVKARKRAREKLRRFGGRLIIKKYPMGRCSLEDLERLMDYLEMYENFVPDILINDYPDIMNMPDHHAATRDNLNRLYIRHKGWADERNMLVVVMSQARREAIRAKRLTMKDFAEDIRKLANVDTAIGICQTDAQAGSNLGTLYVVAARDGVMDTGCGFVMNLDVGQFATDSFPISLGVSVAEDEDDE